ncbi:MAG: hypothetical protein V1934_01015 [Methanobacteriota archaeon]
MEFVPMLINQEEGWRLPELYDTMTPTEKASAIKSCVLTFLNNNGPAPKSVIGKAIGTTHEDSLKRALDYLVHTRQIYSEKWGSRNPVYFPNGCLGHPLYQGRIICGRKEYTIRTYIDRVTGRNLTITEYEKDYSGKQDPKGGIRIDAVDLDAIIRELVRINDSLRQSVEINDRGLISR